MAGGRLALTGELALIEPAGPLHYLDVDVGGQMVKATCAEPNGLSGATVTLSAPIETVHLFDRESGLRVIRHPKTDPWLSIILRNGRVIDPSRISTGSPTSPSLAHKVAAVGERLDADGAQVATCRP